MAHPINMPQVGQDIETAVITEWKIKEGDRIEKGDVVALVESDKAVFEVEAFESGTVLKLLFDEDEEASVLEPIAIIGEEGEEGEEMEAVKEPAGDGKLEQSLNSRDINPSRDVSPPGSVRISASPSARRLAAELGVNINSIRGSGPQGRVVKEDILEVSLKEKQRGAEEASGGQPSDLKDIPPGDTVIPFSRMRQSIADRMTGSARDIPHFYLTIKADLTEFLAWREQYLDQTGNKISITALSVKSVASALTRFPKMNASVASESMILRREINIGVAVSLEDGLVVPVIPDASNLDLAEISRKLREISESARKGILTATAPGTFTVSNLGMLGISEFLPIINPPEAGILGVGSVEKQVILLNDGKVCSRNIMSLTLGCDHRAVDGYYAGQFLKAVREEIGKIELWQNL